VTEEINNYYNEKYVLKKKQNMCANDDFFSFSYSFAKAMLLLLLLFYHAHKFYLHVIIYIDTGYFTHMICIHLSMSFCQNLYILHESW
jgi:hypothetical protein